MGVDAHGVIGELAWAVKDERRGTPELLVCRHVWAHSVPSKMSLTAQAISERKWAIQKPSSFISSGVGREAKTLKARLIANSLGVKGLNPVAGLMSVCCCIELNYRSPLYQDGVRHFVFNIVSPEYRREADTSDRNPNLSCACT